MVAAPKPPKWRAVSSDDIRANLIRLDAEGYIAGNTKRRITASAHGAMPLTGPGGLADAYVCGRFKRIWLDRGGIPIFQPSAVPELDPEPDGYLSPRTPTDLDALRVRAGQILVTCSGTVGKAALVSKTLDGQVFSHDLLRITCHAPADAGYVYAFLKSRTGHELLCSNRYGAVITHIEPEHLASIPVPDAPVAVKRRIHEAVAKSYSLRDESNDLLHRATSLLAAALDLPPVAKLGGTRSRASEVAQERDPPLCFSVPSAELAGRLDGSYHVPIVKKITQRLKRRAAEVAVVDDSRISRAVILPGRFKRVYVEEGYGRPMIGGKQLGELDPSGKKYLSFSKHKAELESLSVKPNTILVTRSGTVGRVAITPSHWDGWIPSDHILRVIPASSEIAGYLYVWLASEWAKPLILRNTYGAVIDEISDAQLAAVPVPLLADAAAQAEINALALKANALRADAYALERAALADFESIIS